MKRSFASLGVDSLAPWMIRAVRVAVPILAVFGVVGCGGSDEPTSTSLAGPSTYWAVDVDQHAVSLALTAHNTVQLTARVLSIDGKSITDANAPVYSTRDSAIRVTPTGLVTARYQTGSQPAKVLASISHESVTLVDTVLIHVDSLPPVSPLGSFVLHSNGDSARVAASNALIDQSGTLMVVARDAAGQPFPDSSLLTYYSSSDPSIASFDRNSGAGFLHPNVPGHVRLYATTLAFGVARRDSIDFLVTYPIAAIVQVSEVVFYDSLTPVLQFQPRTVTVGVGGTVEWINNSGPPTYLPIDVVFDDPADVAPACAIYGCDLLPKDSGGNIAPFALDTTTYAYPSSHQARSFPKAGRYAFHSARFGTKGAIVVKEGL